MLPDVLKLDVSADEAMAAIGSVLPLDLFVPTPVAKITPSPGNTLPPLGVEVQRTALAALGKASGASFGVEEVERFEFYDRAKSAYCLVQCTGERRPYGCFLVTKGVVGPDGKDLAP